MWIASFIRLPLVSSSAPLFLTRSEPARSTIVSLPEVSVAMRDPEFSPCTPPSTPPAPRARPVAAAAALRRCLRPRGGPTSAACRRHKASGGRAASAAPTPPHATPLHPARRGRRAGAAAAPEPASPRRPPGFPTSPPPRPLCGATSDGAASRTGLGRRPAAARPRLPHQGNRVGAGGARALVARLELARAAAARLGGGARGVGWGPLGGARRVNSRRGEPVRRRQVGGSRGSGRQLVPLSTSSSRRRATRSWSRSSRPSFQMLLCLCASVRNKGS